MSLNALDRIKTLYLTANNKNPALVKLTDIRVSDEVATNSKKYLENTARDAAADLARDFDNHQAVLQDIFYFIYKLVVQEQELRLENKNKPEGKRQTKIDAIKRMITASMDSILIPMMQELYKANRDFAYYFPKLFVNSMDSFLQRKSKKLNANINSRVEGLKKKVREAYAGSSDPKMDT